MDQTFKQALLLVLCFLIVVSVHVQGCIYKECSCDDSSIICEAMELTKMPTLRPSITQYSTLDLDMNKILDIPEGSLPPNLTAIYMEENPTTTIAEKAFDGSLYTLQTLIFSSAMFTRIPDSFRHLKTLKTLNIANVSIHDWNEEAMRNIGQTLESLDLENVGMTSWPRWLQYFGRLTSLTISGGSFPSIPDDAFDNVNNTLTSLTLTNNNLTTIPKAISKCTALQELNIQGNKIVNVTWLPRDSKLFTLKLSGNLISDANHLSNALRPFEATLSSLSITSNRLTSIPNITFLTLVEFLDFSNNRLSDPYSGSVASTVQSIEFKGNLLPSIPRVLITLPLLPELDLTSNSITQIQESDFPFSIESVNLGFNLIAELTDNSFPINSKITNLHLNNNPIVTISNQAFKNVVNLVELNLQGTRLTRLPLALSLLASLKILDMSDSHNLVCTCQEKSLDLVILMPSIDVSGQCGLLDIYQFFLKFSSLCPPQ